MLSSLPTDRRPPWVMVALLGLFILLIGLFTWNRGDYIWFFRCPGQVFLAGGDPYSCESFYYLPPAVVFMALFSLFPMPWDAAVWSLTVAVSFFLGLIMAAKSLGMLEARTVKLLLLLVLCPCSLYLLTYQQSTAFMVLLQAGALLCLQRGRYLLAMVLVVLMVFKPQLMVGLIPFVIPLPTRYKLIGAVLFIAIVLPITALYFTELQKGLQFIADAPHEKPETLALREVTDFFSDAAWWRQISGLWLVPPFLYFVHGIYRLWRVGQIDFVAYAQLTPAALLWAPYNRPYDLVLVIFSYLVLWHLVGRRWSRLFIVNILLAFFAFPFSVFAFLSGIPIALNWLPLVVVIFSLHRMAAREPERAAALRWPVGSSVLAANRSIDRLTPAAPV